LVKIKNNITNFKEFSVTSEAGKDNKQLVEEIQKCIDKGLTRFQLRMQFAHEVSDNDGEWDDVKYGLDKVLLKIAY
jgi:dTDP-D-glucose 4,6-dehydratase